MALKQPRALFWLNLLGFLLVFFCLSFLVFYQLFVNQSQQRLPLARFLSPSVFSQALKSLVYHQPDLGQPSLDVSGEIKVELSCRPICQFNLINRQDSKLIKTIPALVDNDPAGRLKELKLAFVDSSAGLIGYQTLSPDNPSFFVLSFEEKLLQTIRLHLSDSRSLQFVNYYSATKQMLFLSTNLKNNQQEYFLYAADRPSLKIVKSQE